MFLTSAVRAMKLESVRVLEGRVEDHMSELRGALTLGHALRRRHRSHDPGAARLVSDHGIVMHRVRPDQRPLSAGEWVTIPGVRRGNVPAVCNLRQNGPRLATAHCRSSFQPDRLGASHGTGHGKFDCAPPDCGRCCSWTKPGKVQQMLSP